jgi:hypothetical protein
MAITYHYVSVDKSGGPVSPPEFNPSSLSNVKATDVVRFTNNNGSSLDLDFSTTFWNGNGALTVSGAGGTNDLVAKEQGSGTTSVSGDYGGSSTSFSVTFAASIPATPTGLSASYNPANGVVTFSWNHVNQFRTSYTTEHFVRVAGGSWGAATTTSNIIDNNYVNLSGLSRKERYFRVKTVGYGGSSGWSGNSNIVSNYLGSSNTPTIVQLNSSTMRATWSSVTNATGYKLYRRYTPVGGSQVQTYLGTTASTTTDFSIIGDGSYKFVYVPYDAAGDGSTSSNSNTITVLTDNVPDNFSIGADLTGAARSSSYSHTFNISGMNTSSTISITGDGTFTIRGISSSTAYDGDTVVVTMNTPSGSNVEVECTLNIGGVTASRSITTAGYDYYSTPTPSLVGIKNFFGGNGAILNYGRGGSNVPNITQNNSVALSGSAISIMMFTNVAKLASPSS